MFAHSSPESLTARCKKTVFKCKFKHRKRYELCHVAMVEQTKRKEVMQIQWLLSLRIILFFQLQKEDASICLKPSKDGNNGKALSLEIGQKGLFNIWDHY